MKSLALTAALVVATSAHAGELVVHVGSQHGDRTYEHEHTTTTNIVDPGTGNVVVTSTETTKEVRPYNNFNPGIAYRFDNELAVGIYRNSYRKPAVYVGYMPMWQTSYEPLKLGGVVIAATGYEPQTGQKLSIGGALAARYAVTKEYGIYVLHLPKITSSTVSVTHLMIGKEFP